MNIKQNLYTQESGISSILLVVVFMILTGVMLWQTTDSLFSSAKMSKGLSEGERFAANIIARSKKLLQKNVTGCGSLNTQFAAYRNFSSAAPKIQINLATNPAAVPCLILASEQSFLDPTKSNILEISEQMTETALLYRQSKLSINLFLKKIKGVPVRSVKHTRTFGIRVASADYFNVMLRGTKFPLISTDKPFLDFTGSVYYSTNSPISIEQIHPNFNQTKVRFSQPFFVRYPYLNSSANTYAWDDIKAVFSRGLETGALNNGFVDAYLPANNNNWVHDFDYHYLVDHTGYPLPKMPTGHSTVDCGSGLNYNAGFGAISKVPETNGGLPTAAFSCQDSLSPVNTFVYMHFDKDFTLDLKPSDNIFCGLVTAKTLTINVPAAGQYALFGNFFVENIVVTGSPDAVVHFHNPQDNLPTDVTFPDTQSQQRMVEQFKRLASSTAYNYFSPMGSSNYFLPRAPINYMVTGGGCAASEYKYNSNYPPITLATQFAAYINNTAGAAYIVEDEL